MANLITITRILIVFLVICLLFWCSHSNILYFIAFVLTIIAIVMDAIDGYVARKYNLATKFGAVLDIIGDRVVENVYWIAFSVLTWVPVVIPIIVITRGIAVDGIRGIALEHGMTAFGNSTMMQSKIGKLLVSSKLSRGSYAAFKGIAFSALILVYMPHWDPSLELVKMFFWYLGYISVYITLFLCVVRGLPVIIEGKRFLDEKDSEDKINTENNSGSIA